MMVYAPLFLVEVFVIVVGLFLCLMVTCGRLGDISFSRN